MSKITNPTTEASVSCGFYNSSSGDRKYDALQVSSLFDGLIRDGVFMHIGDRFMVRADANARTCVNVGTGKAWFNHTWTKNDATLNIDCGAANSTYDRIDVVVIEVNSNPSVRDNFIKVVHGTPSTTPVRPELTHDTYINQYPLCYIYRPADYAGTASILQKDITFVVGKPETPYVTGILDDITIDAYLAQWEDELDQFILAEMRDVDAFKTEQETDFDEWYTETKALMENFAVEIHTWSEQMKEVILDDNLTAEILTEIGTDEIQRFLVSGLNDGETTTSPDGTVITTTDSSGRKLTRTFTNNFMTCTTILLGANGGELGRLVKDFSADGLTISSTMTVTYDPSTVTTN